MTLTDDLDGSKADRTVEFAFDETRYEIDLSKRNAAAFEKAISSYVNAARKVRSSRKRGRGAASTPSARPNLAAVQKWAQATRLAVSDRGRIAKTVQDAYDDAH